MNTGLLTIGQPHHYQSEEVVMAAGRTTFELPLSTPPTSLRAVVVCRTTEASYVPGDEADISSVSNIAGLPATFYWGNGKAYVANYASSYISNALSPGATSITLANWGLKIYASWPALT